MIADLDETIRKLLIAEIPIKNGEIDIKFDQPKREWSAKLTKPSINIFLIDIKDNAELRRQGWRRLPQKNGGNGQVTQRRMPFRVDCFYMMTTWAAEAEDEHRLLTRAMLALFRYPELPDDYLVGQMKHQEYPLRAALARHDRLTNPAEVWSSLDNEMRPSVSYIINITLDPWAEVTGPAVRTYTMRVGEAAEPTWKQRLLEDGFDIELVTFSGTVYEKAKDGAPQTGIDVAIKGTGFLSTTDSDGHYELGGVEPGDYTIIVWPPKGKPKEKKISIPASPDDYDLII